MGVDTYHRQVTVVLNLVPVEVDEGIAGLLVALNAGGFRTAESCQDFGEMLPGVPDGLAMVAFDGRAHAVEFQRLTGGKLLELTPEDRANALEAGLSEGDEYDVPLSTVPVLFPAAAIQATVAKVEKLAAKGDDEED